MPQAFERHTISFVLRLWMEPMQERDEHNWRGQLEHVGSGEKAYFQVPEAILSLLAGYLAEPGKVEAKNASPTSPIEENEYKQQGLHTDEGSVRSAQGE